MKNMKKECGIDDEPCQSWRFIYNLTDGKFSLSHCFFGVCYFFVNLYCTYFTGSVTNLQFLFMFRLETLFVPT